MPSYIMDIRWSIRMSFFGLWVIFNKQIMYFFNFITGTLSTLFLDSLKIKIKCNEMENSWPNKIFPLTVTNISAEQESDLDPSVDQGHGGNVDEYPQKAYLSLGVQYCIAESILKVVTSSGLDKNLTCTLNIIGQHEHDPKRHTCICWRSW